ncbi:MAG: hypothetical protein WBV92_08425 [Nitrosotalea sp.]
MHFWLGSHCYVENGNTLSHPTQVTAISDVITLVSDLGNHIPDKSWMLYLLELFNAQQTPVELNLICSFNDDGKFHAIFGGVNQFEFKIKPIVEHSYLRQIIMESAEQRISYHLKDLTTGETDSFVLQQGKNLFDFTIVKNFTGLEWHNRVGNTPYPIRYEVKISHLAYGINDNRSDLQSLTYFPYNQLIADYEGRSKEYPVSLDNFEIKEGFITYRIGSGKYNLGIINRFLKPYL